MYQQTLDFGDTVDAATATNESIQKEKFLSQDTAHRIAKEEAMKQFK